MHNEHHHFELDKILHDRMSKMYIFQALLIFVKSLIGIFVPVYLYSKSYPLASILLYTIGHSLIYLIMIPSSVKIIKKLGFKYTILLSIPIYFFHIITINYIDDIIFFHLAWISLGFYTSIFWPAFHSEIAVNGSNKHRNSQIGTLQIISIIFASIAPLIGGFILEFSNYWILLVISMFFLLIGLLPLLYSNDIKLKSFNFEYKDYIKLIRENKLTYSKKAFACEGVETLLNIYIWPILVFILLSANFLKFGILLSSVSIISVFLIIYIKSYLDKKNKSKILKKISRLLSFNFLLRSLVIYFGSFFLYFVEIFSKLILNTFHLSFSSIFYNNAKKTGYMKYIIIRELYLHTTKIIFAIFSIIILLIYGENIQILSIILLFGIIFSLGLSYLKEE